MEILHFNITELRDKLRMTFYFQLKITIMEKVFFDGELGKVCGVLETVDNKDEIVILVH